MNVGKIWHAQASEGNKLQKTISWTDFLSPLVEILLAKTHRQWDESEIGLLYPLIALKIEALVDDLIPAAYQAELHGRRQPQNWEDYLGQAIELLLAGKRQWNQQAYPDISEQIKAIVKSLVSNTKSKQPLKAAISTETDQALETDQPWVDNFAAEESIFSEASNLNDLNDMPILEIPRFNFGEDSELGLFAQRLQEFIEVKQRHKHHINVVLKPNKEIASGLGLPESRVRELKKALKKKLQPYKHLLL